MSVRVRVTHSSVCLSVSMSVLPPCGLRKMAACVRVTAFSVCLCLGLFLCACQCQCVRLCLGSGSRDAMDCTCLRGGSGAHVTLWIARDFVDCDSVELTSWTTIASACRWER
eukprot:2143720-Rhodomonas_salina.10